MFRTICSPVSGIVDLCAYLVGTTHWVVMGYERVKGIVMAYVWKGFEKMEGTRVLLDVTENYQQIGGSSPTNNFKAEMEETD